MKKIIDNEKNERETQVSHLIFRMEEIERSFVSYTDSQSKEAQK
jgi:hypothetical protein